MDAETIPCTTATTRLSFGSAIQQCMERGGRVQCTTLRFRGDDCASGARALRNHDHPNLKDRHTLTGRSDGWDYPAATYVSYQGLS